MADLEVWRIDLSDARQVDALWPVLEPEEQARARRFHFAHDQRRFVVAHGALRAILGRACQYAAADLRFVSSPYGKPALSIPYGPVFNLTHSGDIALCAVAAEGELGVDVECHRTIDAKALAQRFFSPEEANSIVGLAPPNVDAAFFSCWTRKEAYIKAKGLGLRLPLEQFTVTVDPSAVPRLESSDYAPDDVASYRFWTVPVPDGYSAAMAYCGPADGSLRIFDWRLGE